MSNFVQDFEDHDEQLIHHGSPETSIHSHTTLKSKKKRNLPGNPDPDAEVVALSPRTLMATNRYTCEVCHKGFQRDQNLQLHRRGHNLPWKLKQRPANIQVRKRVYVCPEPNCVHHEPTRALAHAKICGTREYHCDCGTIFSRKDSFVTHRAFCDALNEQNYKTNIEVGASREVLQEPSIIQDKSCDFDPIRPCFGNSPISAAYMSATALLHKAAEMGAKVSDHTISPILMRGFSGYSTTTINPNNMFDRNNINVMETGSGFITDKMCGLYDSSVDMHSSKGGSLLERQVFMGGSETMTVDFLGGGLCGKRDYNGNMVGMPYSNDQHTLHQQQ
ncbi:hypothetical protein SSX86_032489 [Deinandra increscens subsp. villosa]|uniref:C2H2-type domain-containing protein n=1 Tax=Deinandra increscens subsp. villosa TaxID=3103831 RepID=A0AAP0C449_9ASTR